MKGDELIFHKVSGYDSITDFQIEVWFHSALTFPYSSGSFSQASLVDCFRDHLYAHMGKLMLMDFLASKGISVSHKLESDFPLPNRSDFELSGKKYFTLTQKLPFEKNINRDDLVTLPALIPNRSEEDVWSLHRDNETCFAFTFLKPLQARTHVEVPAEFLEWYGQKLIELRQTRAQDRSGINQAFWNDLIQMKQRFSKYEMPAYECVICGYADASAFNYFADTDGYAHFAYALYTGRWYHVMPNGVLSFQEGMVQTHFKHATCPMAALPSFESVLENKFKSAT